MDPESVKSPKIVFRSRRQGAWSRASFEGAEQKKFIQRLPGAEAGPFLEEAVAESPELGKKGVGSQTLIRTLKFQNYFWSSVQNKCLNL